MYTSALPCRASGSSFKLVCMQLKPRQVIYASPAGLAVNSNA